MLGAIGRGVARFLVGFVQALPGFANRHEASMETSAEMREQVRQTRERINKIVQEQNGICNRIKAEVELRAARAAKKD